MGGYILYVADGVRPIFLPRRLGLVYTPSPALAMVASSAGGRGASADYGGCVGGVGGLLIVDASNPNILASALQSGTLNSVPSVMCNVIF